MKKNLINKYYEDHLLKLHLNDFDELNKLSKKELISMICESFDVYNKKQKEYHEMWLKHNELLWIIEDMWRKMDELYEDKWIIFKEIASLYDIIEEWCNDDDFILQELASIQNYSK